MSLESNSVVTEIFVEKHNGFIKDGKPDDEYWEAKEGRFQYRITTIHYKSEERARTRLQEIIAALEFYDLFGKDMKTVTRQEIDAKIVEQSKLNTLKQKIDDRIRSLTFGIGGEIYLSHKDCPVDTNKILKNEFEKILKECGLD